ncbi:VOC family protein [Sphingomonas flavalba]|uniref:VOC family protein n=1 Tax=Sphingomonas flavalba TaxID=2559804 RepID=UPI00109E1BD4|nr:VOC family protein [Sphingomonas flavalba]
MIAGVHHVAISTPDLERFIDHYQRWYGFERVADGGWEPGNERIDRMVQLPDSAARYAMLRLGSFYIEVFQYLKPVGNRTERRMCDPGLIHLCLYVDDAQAEYERLSALGMEFHCPPGGAGTMLATYGRDCDGNVVELLQTITPDHPFPFLRARAPA